MSIKLVAYHGDPALKAKYIARVRAHRQADNLIHGTGWENGKGCAIGCTLESYDHSRYPIELGIPLSLAYLEDRIFEGLKNGAAQLWPEKFLASIQPGADLSLVTPKILLWMMIDEKYGVKRLADIQGKSVIDLTVDVLQKWIEWGEPDQSEAAAAVAAAAAAAVAAAVGRWAVAEAEGFYSTLAEELITLLKRAEAST
jgi:hypothetical protein